MPGPTFVQGNTEYQVFTGAGGFINPTTYTYNPLAFTSNNTAGNTIIVVAGAAPPNLNSVFNSTSPNATCTDTAGNSYTQVALWAHGTNSGPDLAVWYAKNIAGPLGGGLFNTVNVHANGYGSFNDQFQANLLIAEMSGFGTSPTIPTGGAALDAEFSNSVNTITITDHNGTSVTVQVGEGTTSGPPPPGGSNVQTWALFDLYTGSQDFLLLAGYDEQPSTQYFTVTPWGYAGFQVLINQINAAGSFGTGQGIWLYGMIPGQIQPQLFVIT